MTLANIAPEIFLHILSFLHPLEIYRIRSVSRTWQLMCEEYIFTSIRSRQVVTVKIGKVPPVTIELVALDYDPVNRVIEFRPANGGTSTVTIADGPGVSWNAQKNRMQIHFSQWRDFSAEKQWPDLAGRSMAELTVEEQAQVRFHLQYNPVYERVYELPSASNARNGACEQHYVGDKGLIMALSYVHPNEPDVWEMFKQSEDTLQLDTNHIPANSYAYPNSIAAMAPLSPAPRLQIQWLRVTLAWILSGIEPRVTPVQIYPQRYSCLSQSLAQHGIFKYDPLSEPVLCHIANEDRQSVSMNHCQPHSHFPTVNDTWTELPPSLLDYVQTHSHECHTRLSRLQHLLEGAGVDARVLWKYPFAKNYVVGNGSLVGEEDVVRRIQDSEEEWRLKRQSLLRRLWTVDHEKDTAMSI